MGTSQAVARKRVPRSARSVAPPTVKRKRKSAARTAPGTEALMVRFGKRCKALRAAADLTQQEAAARAGIAITYLQIVERGTTNPSLAILSALAKTYGVSLEEMFKGF